MATITPTIDLSETILQEHVLGPVLSAVTTNLQRVKVELPRTIYIHFSGTLAECPLLYSHLERVLDQRTFRLLETDNEYDLLNPDGLAVM